MNLDRAFGDFLFGTGIAVLTSALVLIGEGGKDPTLLLGGLIPMIIGVGIREYYRG